MWNFTTRLSLFFYTGIPIEFILLAVTIPVSIIFASVLFAVIALCFVVRKRPNKSPLQVADNSTPSTEQRNVHVVYRDRKPERESEHVYSIPRWSRNGSSMVFNSAYQDSITLSDNAAYSSSLKL